MKGKMTGHNVCLSQERAAKPLAFLLITRGKQILLESGTCQLRAGWSSCFLQSRKEVISKLTIFL